MKHIESIQPEYAAEDMTALLVNDITASAALNALLRLVTGCAIPPTSDTPQSEVEELVPLCLSILRRHWQTPLTALGDGTTPMSLADLLRRLILGRVDGNEALGIPPANADIPTAVAALRDRKMYDGLYDANGDPVLQDGESLIALICDTARANRVTKIVDSNTGWTFDQWVSVFPNLTELYVKCSAVPTGNVRLITNGNLEVHLLELETSNNDGTYYAMFAVKKLYLEDYKYGIFRIGGHASYTNGTTQYIYVGCKGQPTDHIRLNNYCYQGGCALAKVQLRDGARQRFTLDCPSFQVSDPYVNMTAENIVDGILTPLADNTDGATITINIGSANVGKLTAEQIAIATDKNYNLV